MLIPRRAAFFHLPGEKSGLGQLDHELHLDGRAEGQFGHADGGPRMSSRFGEDSRQKIAGAVRHFGLIREPGTAVDEHGKAYDSLDRVQRSSDEIRPPSNRATTSRRPRA